MITATMETEHISNRQLVLCALDQSDISLEAHLAECDACRSRVEAYRSVLVATREALTVNSGRVNLISLGKQLILENSECQVGDWSAWLGCQQPRGRQPRVSAAGAGIQPTL